MNHTTLDLEVTRRCNLRCDYCFVGWSRGWSGDLPREVALQIIAEGAGTFSTLHITGGEPFGYAPLFDLIEAGIGHGYARIPINTNGTLITPERIVRLARVSSHVSLSVSLDGPEPLHDAVRGAGRFAQSLDCLRALHAAGIDAQVMTVVTPAVLRTLYPFVRGLYEALPGLRGVTLFPVGVGPAHSQKPGVDLRPLSPDELTQLCLVTALCERVGLPVCIGAYPIANPILTELGYPREKLYQCTAGRGRVCVHADLGVSSCHPVKDPVYGSWRPGLLRELGALPAHRRLAERDFDGCRSCEHKEACGHCRAFVTSGGHDFLGNDEICHEVLARRGPRPSASAGPRRPARLHLPVIS